MDTLLTVFIGVVAVAVLLQALAYVGIYRSLRRIADRSESVSRELMAHVNLLSDKTDSVVAVLKGTIEETQAIRSNVTEICRVVRDRIVHIDAFLQEATDSGRLQIARIQDTVDTATRRVEDTVEILHSTVLKPVSEISALVNGFKVGLDVFLRRKKGPARRPFQDEEMFI